MDKKAGKARLVSCGIAVLILLGGCGTPQLPRVENFPASSQRVARVASHWDVLAEDVAAQTELALGNHKLIHVTEPVQATEFSRAFNNLLVTRLVNMGMAVSSDKAAGIEVRYETQLISHNGAGYVYKPERVKISAAGLMVAYDVLNSSRLPAPGIAGFDFGQRARTELVVTTSATDGDKYVLRKTDIYYIEPEDVPLFLHAEKWEAPVREFRVEGRKQ